MVPFLKLLFDCEQTVFSIHAVIPQTRFPVSKHVGVLQRLMEIKLKLNNTNYNAKVCKQS